MGPSKLVIIRPVPFEQLGAVVTHAAALISMDED
jgi:hypothetical protein